MNYLKRIAVLSLLASVGSPAMVKEIVPAKKSVKKELTAAQSALNILTLCGVAHQTQKETELTPKKSLLNTLLTTVKIKKNKPHASYLSLLPGDLLKFFSKRWITYAFSANQQEAQQLLHEIINQDNAVQLSGLLKAGLIPEFFNQKRHYLPLYAILQGKDLCAQLMIDRAKQLNKLILAGARTDKDAKMVQKVISNKNEKLLRKLLDLGLNPNLADESNVSLLMYATWHTGNLAVMKLLVEYGADINCGTRKDAVLLRAVLAGDLKKMNYLLTLPFTTEHVQGAYTRVQQLLSDGALMREDGADILEIKNILEITLKIRSQQP